LKTNRALRTRLQVQLNQNSAFAFARQKAADKFKPPASRAAVDSGE
jgi:hypothetical protein